VRVAVNVHGSDDVSQGNGINFGRFALLLACLMGQYCSARWRLSSSVTLPVSGRASRRACGHMAACQACGRSCGQHCTAGQYGYVPLGWYLV